MSASECPTHAHQGAVSQNYLKINRTISSYVYRKKSRVFHGRFVSCIPCPKSVFDLNCKFYFATHTHGALSNF